MFQGDDVEFLEEMHQLREIAKIGEGSFGKVFRAIDLSDNSECAVKVVSKTLFKDAQVESDIYQQLNHPHIVSCKRVLKSNMQITDNKNQFFLVMELMRGGTLGTRMNRPHSDEECAIIMKGILLAVHYLHEKRIIHRDLKPENIMFANQDVSSVKIADFGLSFKFASEGMFYSLLNKKCGTVIYMAPEQFKDKYVSIHQCQYSKQIDSWSCGVIMYMVLSQGMHPFYNRNETREQVIRKIMNPIWEFRESINPLAKDLIQKLTTIEPIERYSVGQALIHPWITRNFMDKIPLTYNEQINQFLKEQQIRNVIIPLFKQFKLLFFLQYLLKLSPIQQPYPEDEILIKMSDRRKQQYQTSPKSTKQRGLSNNQKIFRPQSSKKGKSKSKPKTSFENLNTLEDHRMMGATFKHAFKKVIRPKTIEEGENINSIKSRLLIKQKLELPPLRKK